eukprot:GHVN01031943.1.p1 GENE.GHVN01031943.1~~GHVN01031943.1.p1  ORF type:complete len:196 (-),score=57.36 GHVN01031943.1:121-708(-)
MMDPNFQQMVRDNVAKAAGPTRELEERKEKPKTSDTSSHLFKYYEEPRQSLSNTDMGGGSDADEQTSSVSGSRKSEKSRRREASDRRAQLSDDQLREVVFKLFEESLRGGDGNERGSGGGVGSSGGSGVGGGGGRGDDGSGVGGGGDGLTLNDITKRLSQSKERVKTVLNEIAEKQPGRYKWHLKACYVSSSTGE